MSRRSPFCFSRLEHEDGSDTLTAGRRRGSWSGDGQKDSWCTGAAVGHGPPQLSGEWAQGPAEDYRGAPGVRRTDGTGRQRSAAPALQTRLDVEPILSAGGVHRVGHAVRRKGSLTSSSLFCLY